MEEKGKRKKFKKKNYGIVKRRLITIPKEIVFNSKLSVN
jgi:hypothetical protein